MKKSEPVWKIQMDELRMIVFDVDGTLAETDEFYIERVSSVMRIVLFFLPHSAAEKFSREVVMTFETIGHLFYVFLDKLGLDRLFSRLHEKISGESSYQYAGIGGMEQVIRQLRESYQLALITSGGEKSTDAFLEKFHLQDCFDVIVSAQTCSAIKPSPIPMKWVMKEANLQPKQCLMVGDTIFDILCAHRAGAPCAAVKTGFDNGWLLRLFSADIILDSIADLPDWLAARN